MPLLLASSLLVPILSAPKPLMTQARAVRKSHETAPEVKSPGPCGHERPNLTSRKKHRNERWCVHALLGVLLTNAQRPRHLVCANFGLACVPSREYPRKQTGEIPLTRHWLDE